MPARSVVMVLAVCLVLGAATPGHALAAEPLDSAGQAEVEGEEGIGSSAVTPPASRQHETFQVGDVFVGINNGQVGWYLPDGTLNAVLDTGASASETTGMAFDDDSNLYVTAFQANRIYRFDRNGTLLGPWGPPGSPSAWGSPRPILTPIGLTDAGHALAPYLDPYSFCLMCLMRRLDALRVRC